MANRVACHVENAVVRPDQRETVRDLIFMLFQRRHHDHVGGKEKKWIAVELVQSLRQDSAVYRDALSTKTSGPIPVALGYFQLQEGELRLTTDRVPANVAPKVLVRFLSEFVEPGARLWFGTGSDAEGWSVVGVDELVALDPEDAPVTD